MMRPDALQPSGRPAAGRSLAYRGMALFTAAALLAGCTSTRAGRIGADDGGDACRANLVALDSTGNFFAEDIIRGAAIGAVGGAVLGGLLGLATGQRGSGVAASAAIGAAGGAAIGGSAGYLQARRQQAADQAVLSTAIAGDLSAENASIDRTQLAFDQLMDCRFATAQQIREELRQGRVNRPVAEARMADVRARTQRDIQLAQTINQQISERGAQFDTAINEVAPEARQLAVGARVSRSVPALPRATVALKLRPDPASPQVAQVPARERVTLQPASNGFTLVETASGVRGYAPQNAFPEARTLPTRSIPVAQEGDVRTLAASNIARRDNFTESVSNAERLTQGTGFELAT